jgi:hypothetical protein
VSHFDSATASLAVVWIAERVRRKLQKREQIEQEVPVMRLPRLRFTIRGLMVAVAVVAILLMAEKMRRRWHERSLKAAEYAAEAKSWSDDASKVEDMMVKPRSKSDAASRQRLAELDGVARNYRDHERTYGELASRYARAAAHPWLPIETDPSEPK